MTMGDRVDKWLKNMMLPTEEDGARQDMQLAILKERLRTRKSEQRRRRTRWTVAAVPLVVLVVFFGDIVELGGDSFEMVQVESSFPELGMKILRNEFRGGGYAVDPDTPEENTRELMQQIAAGEGIVVGVIGIRIDGVTNWSLETQYIVHGKIEVRSQSPLDPPSGVSRAIVDFTLSEWVDIEKEIESGSRQSTGRLTKEFDGIPFALEYWVISSEKFGEATYYSGVPIR